MEWADWEANGLTENDLRKLHGRDVFSADNQKIGTIKMVWNPMMEVNSTTFRIKTADHAADHDLWVPLFAVKAIDQDRIVLETAKDQIAEHDWTTAPPGWVPFDDESHLF